MQEYNLDFQAAFDAWPAPATILDLELKFRACNAAYEAISHYDRASLIGRPLFEVFPGADGQADSLKRSFSRVLRTRRPHHIADIRYDQKIPNTPNLKKRWWTVSNIPLSSPAGEMVGILHCPLDITKLINQAQGARPSAARRDKGDPHSESVVVRNAQSILNVERERLQHLFQQAPGFMCVLEGPRHVFEMANDAYYQLVDRREIIGRELAEVLPEAITQGYLQKLDRVYQTGEAYIGRALCFERKGFSGGPLEQKYIDLIYQPVFDANRKVTGIFVQGNDVTEACTLAKTISFQAAHDALTGLLNRREFSRLTENIEGAGPHALLYMDLDHFKIVNDRCGHAAGDSLLQEVAAELTAIAGADAVLARLGGDEFALMLRECSAEAAVDLAHRMRRAVKAINFFWRGKRYGVTLSVGVANFSEAKTSFEAGMGLADAACFLAKDAGRNRVKLALPSDEDIAKQQADMDNVTRLKQAIREDRIVLYGQRIVDLSATQCQSVFLFEVLSRLRDVNGEIVAPAGFIPAAERFGMIEELDRHIIAKAFAHLAGLEPYIGKSVCYFINLSGITLSAVNFPAFVEGLLSAYPAIDPSQICFEVTETAAISDLRRSAEAMQRLRQRGFRFALDDFGSGMASFAYLQQLPVQFVKIDGDFVKSVLHNRVSAIIVESVAKLAECMGIGTIAESIESLALLPPLRLLSVRYGQGYALHEPEILDTAVLRGVVADSLVPPAHSRRSKSRIL